MKSDTKDFCKGAPRIPENRLPLPIAIIGLGNQGREHLATCLNHPDLLRVAIACDPHLPPDKWPQLPPDCVRETDPAKISAHAKAVIVATPPTTYKNLLPLLMEQRLHILAEKPPGMNLEEASKHLTTARIEDVVLMPAVQRRFHESYAKVPAMLAKMGRVSEALLRLELDKAPNNWRLSDGIGALFDLGFHALDLARELFGDLHLVTCCLFDSSGMLCRHRFDNEADLLFRSESGTFLRVHVRGSVKKKVELLSALSSTHYLEVTRGTILLKEGDAVIHESNCDPSWKESMLKQLEEFVVASGLPNNRRVENAGKFGLITMKLLEESYARAATI